VADGRVEVKIGAHRLKRRPAFVVGLERSDRCIVKRHTFAKERASGIRRIAESNYVWRIGKSPR
jgi:hypothetical protein